MVINVTQTRDKKINLYALLKKNFNNIFTKKKQEMEEVVCVIIGTTVCQSTHKTDVTASFHKLELPRFTGLCIVYVFHAFGEAQRT